MRKGFHILAAGALLVGTWSAHGKSRTVEKLLNKDYDAIRLDTLSGEVKTMYYTEFLTSFKQLAAKSPIQMELLNIYPGFTEPYVQLTENGKPEEQEIIMYLARLKTVLNVSADRARVESVVKRETIDKLDFDVKTRPEPLKTEELMSNVAGKNVPVKVFKWCNTPALTAFHRSGREADLSFMNPKQRAWCSGANSICLESCFIFPEAFTNVADPINSTLSDRRKKDLGIGTQYEIRYFRSLQDYNSTLNVAQLTGYNTPVRGIIEQNVFYFNQVFQYAKLVSIIQEHPSQKDKALINNFMAFAIKKASWDDSTYRVLGIRQLLAGTHILNTSTGLTAGIPWSTQNLTGNLVDILEGQ